MAKIAFLGLGVMGFPMAGHLAKAGHEVCVYNRSAKKAENWVRAFSRENGTLAPDAALAVNDCAFVFMCLGDDPDVLRVVEAFEEAVLPDAVVVDHTTASPGLARGLHDRFASRGVGFVDAPVSGGQAGAENGKLSVMCGGEIAHVELVSPVMTAYAARSVHIGPPGHGQLAKCVNQICIAGLLQGLSEGLAFADNAGLDVEQLLAAIGGGAAQSWQMDNRAKSMAAGEFDFGFAVDWMRKDLRIALEEARSNGSSLPATALVDQFYGEIQRDGGGRADTSSLITRLPTGRTNRQPNDKS
ncbi:MAG: NAD(P)-dependent oxidoreductase [Pseudomonadota bacterium]